MLVDAQVDNSYNDANFIFDYATADVIGGTSGVVIDIVPPPNAHSGLTGVKVERADNPSFSGAVTVQDFTDIYSLSDTPPSAGTWYYRIIFRNGDGVATSPSPGKSMTTTGP